MNRSFRTVACAAILCGVTVAAIGLWPETRAVSTVAQNPRVELMSQDDTSLSLKYVDSGDNAWTVNFTRPTTDDVWMAVLPAITQRGIIFGNPGSQFAGSARQRAAGVTAQQAITTLEAGITQRPMDDVTIFYLGAGDVAIGLWQNGAIVEIHYVGTFVKEVMDVGFDGWNFCQRAVQLCCRKVDPPDPLIEPQIPRPNVAACRAAASGNCSQDDWFDACNCLAYACNFCANHPGYCCGDPNDIDNYDPNCATPWLPAAAENACNEGVYSCVGPPEPEPGDDALAFEEIINRLQVLVDIQNNS